MSRETKPTMNYQTKPIMLTTDCRQTTSQHKRTQIKGTGSGSDAKFPRVRRRENSLFQTNPIGFYETNPIRPQQIENTVLVSIEPTEFGVARQATPAARSKPYLRISTGGGWSLKFAA